MTPRIEDHALIGDTETVALVSREGSIDWFCAPRFDSAASFASLLGDADNGSWDLAPSEPVTAIERRYRADTLVLETVFRTAGGAVAVIDFMPVRGLVVPGAIGEERAAGGHHDRPPQPLVSTPSIVRIVEGREGVVAMRATTRLRFDYGSIVPWVRAHDGAGFSGIGGADGLVLHSPMPFVPDARSHVAEFEVRAGTRVRFALTWFPSHHTAPPPFDADLALTVTERWWRAWVAKGRHDSPWRDEVVRSLITLKALTYAPTGGIVAAATTSLPEHIGGVRNWDYRFCWLRDATYTLTALVDAGYETEAAAWSNWLRRAVAGSPEKMQIMYGLGGERRLTELELPWLAGYEGSAPVRIGNAASEQFQLDVFGEVMNMLLVTEMESVPQIDRNGVVTPGLPDDAIDLARQLVDHVRQVWREPDEGIWEVRGPRRHFVHSKAMAWVAIDRWVKLIAHRGLDDDPAPWVALCDEIHAEVCERGFDAELGSFTQFYGSGSLDASLLTLGPVGFLAPDDPRLIGTVEAIQRDLVVDGFVVRYLSDAAVAPGDDEVAESTADGDHPVDGLPPGEGAFLLTTFWLVDALVLIGRGDEARTLFERLVALANDVGLLAEEYDTAAGRMLGNFPQAFSHVGLLSSALTLADPERARPPGPPSGWGSPSATLGG